MKPIKPPVEAPLLPTSKYPCPWYWRPSPTRRSQWALIHDANGEILVHVSIGGDKEENWGIAALIVEAVNRQRPSLGRLADLADLMEQLS